MSNYVVTADDVGAVLAVLCTPMDDNGRQVVSKYSLGQFRVADCKLMWLI